MTAREQAIAIVVELRRTSRIYLDLNAGLSLRLLHEARLVREAQP